MAKTKVPGKRLLPEVQAFIDAEFSKGKTATQVYKEIERLKDDERQRRNRLGDIHLDDLNVSYRVIADRRRWWAEHQQATQITASDRGTLTLTEEKAFVTVKQVGVSGQAQVGTPRGQVRDVQPPANYPWWFLEPDDARAVLTAIAAWESVTGTQWGNLSRQTAQTIMYFARVAPDLPPHAIAALADQAERWAHLPITEAWRRWDALGRFLGYRPWSSPEAAARYAQAVAGADHFVLTEDGLPIYVVTVSAKAVGTSVVSANLTVGHGDGDAGHDGPSHAA
jgi:hypothetical protein